MKYVKFSVLGLHLGTEHLISGGIWDLFEKIVCFLAGAKKIKQVVNKV